MAKVDADHLASVEVQHKVGEMPVTDPQHILAHAQHGVGLHTVAA